MGRWLSIAVCNLFLASVLAPDASALGIDPNPIPITSGIRGVAHLISVVQGTPEGAVVFEGSVEASDISLVFRVDLFNDSAVLGLLGVFAADVSTSLLIQPSGAGAVAGAGVDVTGALRVTSPGAGESIRFLLDGDALNPGESTDLFFVSYPVLIPGNSAGVLVGVADAPRRDGFSGTIVPEPSPGLLLAAGLALLSLHARSTTGRSMRRSS